MSEDRDRAIQVDLEPLSKLASKGGSLEGVVRDLLRACAEVIDGADEASVSVMANDSIATLGATNPIIRELDRTQFELQEGPCLSSAARPDVYLVQDFSTDSTWPDFSRRAAGMGFSSLLALPLASKERSLGALNLYARSADAFSGDDVRTAAPLAGLVASLLTRTAAEESERRRGEILEAHARELELILGEVTVVESQLQEALRSRDVIGQAKGILMAREGCTEDEAFEMLRTASQHLNKKLRDVAHDVVEAENRTPPGEPGKGNGGDARPGR